MKHTGKLLLALLLPLIWLGNADAVELDTTVLNTTVADTVSKTQKSKMDKLVDEFQKLSQKYAAEIQKARRASRSQKEFQEKTKEIRKKYPDSKKMVGEIYALAKKKPKSKSSRRALSFLAVQPVHTQAKKFAEDALIKYHSKGDGLISFASSLAAKPSLESEALLKKILKTKASKSVKSVAAYGVADNMIAKFKGDKSEEKDIVKKLAAAKKYGAKVKIGNKSLKDLANSKLFYFTKLRVGVVADDITGEDLDGKKFKLSDYRGKVVFLDFWGDW